MFLDLLERLAGTSLPPHLYFIEQLIAIAFAFTMIVSVIKIFSLILERGR